MVRKPAQEAAKKKAAKQKKILVVLLVALVVALVYGYMTLSGGHSSSQPVSATPESQTTPASSIPGGGTPPATPAAAGLDLTPDAALTSFADLGRKDPFFDKGPNGSTSTSTTSTNSDSSGSSSSKSGGSSKPSQPSAPLTGAVISLNGTKLSLAIGSAFGHAPGLSGVSLFRLVSVTKTTAVVGVVGTTQQFTLHVGRTLTLAQTGGWTYNLVLEPLGSAAPMTVQTQTTTTTGGH